MSKRKDGLLDFNSVPKQDRKKAKKSRKNADVDAFEMKPRKKRGWIVAVIVGVVLLIGLSVFMIVRDNHLIRVSNFSVADAKIPKEFDGFRILQISDFDGKSFGPGNRRLTSLVKTLDFDIVLLTGDFLDSARDPDSFWPVAALMETLCGMGKPIYFVLGENDIDPPEDPQENWNCCIEDVQNNPVAMRLEEYGAVPVYPIQMIERGGSRIFLTGTKYYEKIFDSFRFDSDKDFSICVTHAPIDYDVDNRLASINRYSFREVDFDMSVSGHTLGGQYRLPLLKTLFLPGHGLFPQEEFAYGFHKIQGRYKFITAGLGVNSGFRLFDKAEVAIIELHSAAD